MNAPATNIDGPVFLTKSAESIPMISQRESVGFRCRIIGQDRLKQLYYISWDLVLIVGMLNIINYISPTINELCEHIKDILQVAAFLGLSAKIIFDLPELIRNKEWIAPAIALPLICLSTLSTRTFTLLGIYLLVVAAKGISLKKMGVHLVWIYSITLGIVIIGYFFGLFKDYIITRDNDESGALRHSLGFIHPNSMARVVLYIVLAQQFVQNKKFKPVSLTLYLLVAAAIFGITGSRTSAGLIVLSCLTCLIRQKSNKISRISACLMGAVVIFLTLLMIYLMVTMNYESGWNRAVDSLTSGRVSYAHLYYESYGVGPFGRGIEITDNRPLDNAFIRLLLKDGLLPFIIVFIYSIITIIILSKNKEIPCEYALYFVISLVYGCFERTAFTTENYFLIIGMATALYHCVGSRNFLKEESIV